MSTFCANILSPKNNKKPNCNQRKATGSTFVKKIVHKMLMKLTPIKQIFPGRCDSLSPNDEKFEKKTILFHLLSILHSHHFCSTDDASTS